MAHAAYRQRAFSVPRQRDASPWYLFSLDDPPLRNVAQEAARAAYRPAGMPVPSRAITDPWFLFSLDDPPLRATAQEAARAAYRPAGMPAPARMPVEPWFLFSLDDPPLRNVAQEAARAAYRPLGAPQPARLPVEPWFLFSLDEPTPRSLDPQLVAAAYRAASARPIRQAADALAALLYQTPAEDPPLQGATSPWPSYRGLGQPQRLPPMFSPSTFPPVVEGPPLTFMDQQLVAAAYRAATQPRRPLPFLHAGIFPPVVDSPPLMGAWQQFAQTAYRGAFPRPMVPGIPAALFIPPADFPFPHLAQQLTRAALRTYDYGVLASLVRVMRPIAFDALFPVTPIIPPTPGTVQIITGYATSVQMKKALDDIAGLRRDLRNLISLMEKRGFKT